MKKDYIIEELEVLEKAIKNLKKISDLSVKEINKLYQNLTKRIKQIDRLNEVLSKKVYA